MWVGVLAGTLPPVFICHSSVSPAGPSSVSAGQDIYNSSYANIPQDPKHTAYCLAQLFRTVLTSLQVSSDHVDIITDNIWLTEKYGCVFADKIYNNEINSSPEPRPS